MTKILVVEDEASISNLIAVNLRKAGASGDTHILPMENGKHYTKESMMEKSLEELAKLAELGIPPSFTLETDGVTDFF